MGDTHFTSATDVSCSTTTERSVDFSPRIEETMQSRSKSSDQVELEIELAKPHGSEVSDHADLSEVHEALSELELEWEEEKDEENKKLVSCSCFHIALLRVRLPSILGRPEYFSPRIAKMMQSRRKFSNQVELEIEFSRSHWSEVNFHTVLSDSEYQENRRVFEELMNDPEIGSFFKDSTGSMKLQLGRKIAVGGQAEIFEAVVPKVQKFKRVFFESVGPGDLSKKVPRMVLKVFKRGFLLHDLRRLWPLGVLQRDVCQCVYFGTMLEDGRFAFLMQECWGDLRKLIDEAMLSKGNAIGPPFPFVITGSQFPDSWVHCIMRSKAIISDIAIQMKMLHLQGIFHRDLKSSNILYRKNRELILADFESSIGVLGTTFYRAPEILLALKKKEDVIFTEKADVYSYGMTCFEVVTGRLPFEGELEEGIASYDLVIQGRRPKLPRKLEVGVKELIRECWHPDPEQRPTFRDIVIKLSSIEWDSD